MMEIKYLSVLLNLCPTLNQGRLLHVDNFSWFFIHVKKESDYLLIYEEKGAT